MMHKEDAYRDAQAIFAGAVNLTAISNTLAEWCSSLASSGADTETIHKDPAVILIVYQMASLTKVLRDDDRIFDAINTVDKFLK